MSREYVQLVRRGVGSTDAFWAMLDEYVVWDTREMPLPDLSGVTVGRDAVIKGSRHDAEEFIDAGSSVIIVVRERGRGKGSGIPFDRRWAQIWTFLGGRIIRWELFPDKAAALEAAGLVPHPSRPLLFGEASPRGDTAQAMSQENVEIVRQAFAAFSRGGPEALANFWDPGIEVSVPSELAEAGTYRGREAVLAWMSKWSDAWERIEYTPEEIVGDGDTVLVTLLYDGVGKGSGLRIDGRYWYLIRMRDGKIVNLRLYGDRNEALEAAGLSE